MTDFAMDWVSPARHIGTELEGAPSGALSVSELAATYHHSNSGDVSRVKHYAKVDTEAAAYVFIIGETMQKLRIRGKSGAEQLVEVDGLWRFADGVTFDDLRFDGKKLVRNFDPHKELRNPFNRMSGQFSDNVGITSKRMDTRNSSLEELRESLRRYGWRKEMPGVVDENGTLLIGHRRWAICDELGITERPTITIRYGEGDDADRNRFIGAIVSQIGFKPFTDEEWKRIARYLRAQGETIQAIADVLHKPYVTVQREVKDTATLSNLDNVDSLGRAKNQGRPRKPKKIDDPVLINAVEQRMQNGESVGPLKEEFKVSAGTLDSVQARLIGRAEGREHALAELSKPTPTGHECEFVSVMMCLGCGRVHD